MTLTRRAYHSLFGRAGMGRTTCLRRRGPLTMAPSQLGILTRAPTRARARQYQFFHVHTTSARQVRRTRLHTYPAFTTSVV